MATLNSKSTPGSGKCSRDDLGNFPNTKEGKVTYVTVCIRPICTETIIE